MSWSLNDDDDLDNKLSTWMQKSAASLVLCSQLRAMRSLIQHPEVYASKLVNDHSAALDFKNAKSVGTLQNMLTEMCVPATTNNLSTPRSHVRALAGDLVDPSQSTRPEGSSTSKSRRKRTGLIDPTSTTQHEAQQSQTGQSLTNDMNTQLMDMILSLQNQMQIMQQQSAKSISSENTSSTKSQKRKAKELTSSDSSSEDEIEQKKQKQKKTEKATSAQESTLKQRPSTVQITHSTKTQQKQSPQQPLQQKKHKKMKTPTETPSKERHLKVVTDPHPPKIKEEKEISKQSKKAKGNKK